MADIEKLNFLLGIWKGSGIADFPTINKTPYIEELSFVKSDDKSVIFYELKTWVLENGEKGEPLSWQTGFITVNKKDCKYELSNAQNNGRVEVLSGSLEVNGNEIHLSFESKAFGNDERLIKTTRDFYVEGNKMKYTMFLAIKASPQLSKHLEAELRKV